MIKKLASLVLPLALALSISPAVAFADPVDAQAGIGLSGAAARLDVSAPVAASADADATVDNADAATATAQAASVPDFVPAAKRDAHEGEVYCVETEYENPLYGGAGLTIISEGYVPDVRTEVFASTLAMSTDTTNASSVMTMVQAGAAFREALCNCSYSVHFTMPRDKSMSLTDHLLKVVRVAEIETTNPFQGDYIAWGWGGWTSEGSTVYTYDSYYDVTLHLVHYTTYYEEQYVKSRVSSILSSLNLDGMSDYQKCAAIHDWIVQNVSYDFPHLNDNSYKYQYTAYAALYNKTAVCQGMSRLYYCMCESAGVNTRIICGLGNGGSHSWNISRMIDGAYYYVDCTWDRNMSCDDKNNGSFTYTHRDWFMLGEDVFEDHVRYGANGATSSSSLTPDYTTSAFYAKYPMGSGKYDPATASSITLSNYTCNYSGNAVRLYPSTTGSTGGVTIKYYRDSSCSTLTGTTINTGKADYAGGAPRSAGTYYVKAWLSSDGYYRSAVSNVAKIVIRKVSQPIKTTINSPYVRYSESESKTAATKPLSISGNKASLKYTLVSAVNASGKSVKSRFSISSTKGTVKVASNTELGTYTLKIKVTAPTTKNYKSFSKTYTVKVRVLKATKTIKPAATKVYKTYYVATSGPWRYMLSYNRTYTFKTSLVSGSTKLPTSTLRYKIVSAIKTSNSKDMTSKFSITSKGVLTTSRGLMKGKYKVKIKITSCATTHYKAATAKYVYFYLTVK